MELGEQITELRKLSKDGFLYSDKWRNNGVATRYWVIGNAPTIPPPEGIDFKPMLGSDSYTYVLHVKDK